MVKFINGMGGTMYVAEDRVEEYKAAGFKPVALDVDEVKPTKKTATKKRTAKKEK